MYFTDPILVGFFIAGLVLAFNGVVQLFVRNKTGPWKEGGANFLAGAIIAGVSLAMLAMEAGRLILLG
jgi:hypothetical protein